MKCLLSCTIGICRSDRRSNLKCICNDPYKPYVTSILKLPSLLYVRLAFSEMCALEMGFPLKLLSHSD